MNQHVMPQIAAAVPVDLPARPHLSDLEKLGLVFDQLHTLHLQLQKEHDRLGPAFDASVERARASNSYQNGDRERLLNECGLADIIDKLDELHDAIEVVSAQIRAITPISRADFFVRLKMLSYNCSFSSDFDKPEQDMDWDVFCLHELLRQVEASLGQEARS